MRHICTISGKDSFCTAMLLRERNDSVPMEYVWHDTGWELPEVHEWICRVEEFLGTDIIRLGDDLTEIVAEQGMLPSHRRRFCTKYAKIKPMRDFSRKTETTIYLGLRADEDDRIQGLVPSRYETYRFPLKEKGLGFEDVWQRVHEVGMSPPTFFWEWMSDRVEELGGLRPEGMPNWVWSPLFAGRSRPNCDRCFYQRTYEWIWLHETHPDLFWSAVETEESTQHASSFRFRSRIKEGKTVPSPLVDLLPRAEQIKENRAKWIVRYLNSVRGPLLFSGITEDNPFKTTSCGLFCGK